MADISGLLHSPVVSGMSGQVDTVRLSGSWTKRVVEVLNVDGNGYLNFRADGIAAVQNAAENKTVPAVAGAFLRFPAVDGAGQSVNVSIIPSANCKYQVSLVQAELGGR